MNLLANPRQIRRGDAIQLSTPEDAAGTRALPARRAGRTKVEEQLINILNASGEAELNRIRDSARALADVLDAHKELKELDSLVGALLGTHAKGLLKTRMGQLVASGTPVDSERLMRFERLAQALQITVTPRIPDVAASGDAKIHFAFLDKRLKSGQCISGVTQFVSFG